MGYIQSKLLRRALGTLGLVIIALLLISYGLLIARIDSANDASAKRQYQVAEERYLLALRPFRQIPVLKTLMRGPYQVALLNYAQLLYTRGKYTEVVDTLEREALQFPYLAGTGPYRLWMGNALFRVAILQGGRDKEDVGPEALQTVAEEYEKAIEADRTGWDARYNYEFIRQLLAKQASKDAKEKETLHLLLGEIRLSTEQSSQQRPEKLQ